MEYTLELDIRLQPKPRMTQRDVWLSPPRPCVKRYRDFSDELRKAWKDQGLPAKIQSPFSIHLEVRYAKAPRIDADNCLKTIGDVLQYGKIIEDDSISHCPIMSGQGWLNCGKDSFRLTVTELDELSYPPSN